MTAGPWFDRYAWNGGTEAMLRFGPATGPTVVVAPPLFEEANRTRALIVAVLRALAGRGIGGALPDLPGQGESELDLVEISLAAWRDAFAGAVASISGKRYVFALRGGTLVADGRAGEAQLNLSPIPGKTLVRDLLRARRVAALAAGERPAGDDLEMPGPPLLLAGNLIGRELLGDLMNAALAPADRTVTLFPDESAADRRLAPTRPAAAGDEAPRFRPPWSASEPFVDQDLAALLAGELAEWIHHCAGC